MITTPIAVTLCTRHDVHNKILDTSNNYHFVDNWSSFCSCKVSTLFTLSYVLMVLMFMYVSFLSWLKTALPKHYKKVLEIAAFAPRISLQFCIYPFVLPQRLSKIPSVCNCFRRYPAIAWGSSSETFGMIPSMVTLPWSFTWIYVEKTTKNDHYGNWDVYLGICFLWPPINFAVYYHKMQK